MTGQREFDRTLAGWFEADALSPAPAGSLDRVVGATSRRRPRPAWLAGPGSLWVGGSSAGVRPLPRLGPRWSTAIVVLLVIAALVGGAILVGARLLQPSLPTVRLGHLAYGLDGDIFVADWDARNPVRIADGNPVTGPAGCGGFWAEGPMWSPDGRHLAYRSAWDASCRGTTGNHNVYIADPEGHTVASFSGTGWLVSWSPDSTRVASWVDLATTIGIYGLDGVRQALLTVQPGCALPGDFDPVWSPDGTSLVIWPCKVPLDGRTPQRLPDQDPRSHAQWAYSPDRARVAYATGGTLVVAAADGSQNRVLISGPAADPAWSPTGDRIAFVETMASGPDELHVVDVASGAETSLASARGADSIRVIKFSPEGDRILFEITNNTTLGATSLRSVNADASGDQLLVSGTGWGDFDWQPLPAGP